MRKISVLTVVIALLLVLSSCQLLNTGTEDENSASLQENEEHSENKHDEDNEHEEHEDDDDEELSEDSGYEHVPNWSDSDLADLMDDSATKITFSGTEITVDGDGAVVASGGVKINEAGTYVLSGTLYDGRIVVSVGDTEIVRLILDGIVATSTTSSPLFIENAEKTIITIMEGTENAFTDAEEYVYADPEENEPNACIFSNDDITINGTGTLIVTANYNNGIATDNDLKIVDGVITVTAPNNGLKGNDSISIRGGTIDVTCDGDGLKVKNDEEADEGYIYIEGGEISIKAGDDALQAVTSLMIMDGTVTTSSGGKTLNCDGLIHIEAGCLK